MSATIRVNCVISQGYCRSIKNRERDLYFEVCMKYDVHPAKFDYERVMEEGSAPYYERVWRSWFQNDDILYVD